MDTAKKNPGAQLLDDELLAEVSGGKANPKAGGMPGALGSKYAYHCENSQCRNSWTSTDLVPQTFCPSCGKADISWVKIG